MFDLEKALAAWRRTLEPVCTAWAIGAAALALANAPHWLLWTATPVCFVLTYTGMRAVMSVQ